MPPPRPKRELLQSQTCACSTNLGLIFVAVHIIGALLFGVYIVGATAKSLENRAIPRMDLAFSSGTMLWPLLKSF